MPISSAHKPIVWRKIGGVVRHVFTHFPLELAVYRAEIPRAAAVPDGMRWIAISELRDEALPSVMRKVVAHGLGAKLGRLLINSVNSTR